MQNGFGAQTRKTRSMGLPYHTYFQEKIDALKQADNYRRFADLERSVGSYPQAIYRPCGYAEMPITVWCSNDYLGMSQNKAVINAMCDTAQSYGTSSGGTRNISGTTHEHILLEAEIADLHRKESALLFSSGYVANQTALITLGKIIPDVIFFSDEKNHASIIQGINQSKCQKYIWKHNDVTHLEQLLQNAPKDKPKIIVFESIYSMDGDIAPLQAICDLAERYDALTYLDEVHAVGLYGLRGAGIAEQENLLDQVTFINGTLGKAFGVVGGYVTGDAIMIDALRSYGSGFIFTTSLPPAICAAARTSIAYLKQHPELRQLHQQRSNTLKNSLLQAGIPILLAASHIVPVMVGNASLCRQMTDMLLYTHNIYVQPLNHPTVEWGTERMRLTPSPLHTEQDISVLTSALVNVFQTLAPDKIKTKTFNNKIVIAA